MASDGRLYRVDSLDPAETQSKQETTPADTSPAETWSSLSTFCYTPLADPTSQIRLCRICPSPSGSSELVIDLRDFDLEGETGRFVALSYVWGDESFKVPMTINKARHAITRNLYTHMCRLRNLRCERWMWIDALCINQDDMSERLMQVGLMGQIFRGVDEVFIGLDDEARDLHQAVDDHTPIAAVLKGLAAGRHVRELTCSPGINQLLDRFLGSAWFRRTWTVQEVCLPQKATIILGSECLPWQTLVRALDQWDKHRQASCCSYFVEYFDPRLRKSLHRVRSYSSIAVERAWR